jgi:hypothetical protein
MVGQIVEFSAEDIDNDDEICYLVGEIKDYKFKNDFKKAIRVFLKDCRRK